MTMWSKSSFHVTRWGLRPYRNLPIVGIARHSENGRKRTKLRFMIDVNIGNQTRFKEKKHDCAPEKQTLSIF